MTSNVTLSVPLAPLFWSANLPDSKRGRWGEGITAEDMASIVWVKPSLVAQVAFTEWTDGGSLRRARFIDLRTDKRAADVAREG